MVFDRKTLLASTFIAGLAAFAPSVVFAQATPPAPQEQEEDDEVTEVEGVVITGSRIRRSNFSSTQPVQIITTEESTLEGLVDTAEILQQSTAANTSGQINNFFTGFVTTGGPGVNTLSLRGLGAQRTLILINGRRAGPAGARGTVGPFDLNTIPSSMLERVEILTDGASSIYGSDAVAGVVNLITAQNRDGGNIQVFTSQPLESGGDIYQVNGSYGWTNDRGYLTVGADYYDQKPLLFGDRDIFRCPQTVNYLDAGLLLRGDVIDPATNDFKCSTITAGVVTLRGGPGNRFGPGGTDYSPDSTAVLNGGPNGCDLAGFRQTRAFSIGFGPCALPGSLPTATLRAFSARTVTDDPRFATRTAISPVTRATFTAFGGYDLTPNIELFGELILNRRESSQDSFRQIFPGLANSLGAPASQPRNPFGAVVDFTIIAPSNSEQQVDYARGVAGARGSLNIGRGFDWELAGQFSRSRAEYGVGFIYSDRFAASLGADGCNEAVLRSATACSPGGVDYFSAEAIRGNLSQVDQDFLFGFATGSTEYTHQYVEGVVSGELFDLPAGPLGAALGFQVRKEEIDDSPSVEESTGLFAGQSSAVRTAGSDTIKEVFAELEIPVLRNLPFINNFTLNVSGRFSDYESYGSNSTYKVGFNWTMSPAWRLRGSQGTSFRAPALFEQFLGNQSSFIGQAAVDPCRNRQASTNPILLANCLAAGVPLDFGAGVSSGATVITGGGRANLTPETAETQSLGLIWTPTFADLSIALDYFVIEIEDQVQTFGAANIVVGCYNSNEFANEPLCSLFTRAPANDPARPSEILIINNSFVNIARQYSEGVDLTARYRRDFSFGDLLLSARASYIFDWETQLRTASVPTQIVDQIGAPNYVANATATFTRNDYTATWNVDYVPEVSNDRFFANNRTIFFGQPVFQNRTVDEVFTHSISLQKRADEWTFLVGVRNVFDEVANPVSASGSGTRLGNIPLTSQYDILGRRLFLNVTRTF